MTESEANGLNEMWKESFGEVKEKMASLLADTEMNN